MSEAIRYVVYEERRPADESGISRWPFRCPDCAALVGETLERRGTVITQLRIAHPVRVRRAEVNGLPTYGLREGAFRRGRSEVRRARRSIAGALQRRRLAMPVHHEISEDIGFPDLSPDQHSEVGLDYVNALPALFETWCPSCRSRVRVEVTRRLPGWVT
jgi:hypothetical protein